MTPETTPDIKPTPVTSESEWTFPENLRGKKIVLVNHSDTLGGAAVVTFRLMQALREQGADARMVVFTKTSEEENVSVVSTRFKRGISFAAERLRILPTIGFRYDNLFKVSTGSFASNISGHPWVREADIICLNWINQGLMSLDGIRRLHRMGKKIVWTLHDMWAMTGICHHSYECDHYEHSCGNCPFLAAGGYPHDISNRFWKKKKHLYSEVPIRFVTVSHWLERRARQSSLLKEQSVTTINNPFPIDQFKSEAERDIYSLISPEKPDIIIFGAARLDDPIKGLDYAIDALNHIFDNYPDVASHTAVYFYGAMKHPEVLDRLRFSHRWLGMVHDFKVIRYLCSVAKVVLSTSLYETLGGTLVEGQAGGAVPVTFAPDGRADVVIHKKNGYIADYKDPKSVAEGILWALEADMPRRMLHDNIGERFASPVIARRYLDLFARLEDDAKNTD